MTEDPAIRAKALRDSLASKGAQLSALVATTDHNGRPIDPEAQPVVWTTDATTGNTPNLSVHEPTPATLPETLDDGPTLTIVQHDGPTLDGLLAKAVELGFSRAQLVIAARHYCGKDDLERLSDDEIVELDRRLTTHASRRQDNPEESITERAETATGGRGRRGQG